MENEDNFNSSEMVAFPVNSHILLEKSEILNSLKNEIDFSEIEVDYVDENQYDIKIKFRGKTYEIFIANVSTSELDYLEVYKLQDTFFVTDEDIDNAIESGNGIYSAIANCENDVYSYLFQIKVLNIIAGQSFLFEDLTAKLVYPGSWLNANATMPYLPGVEYVYDLNFYIYEDILLLFTNGLERYCSVELDMIVSRDNFGLGLEYFKNIANRYLLENDLEVDKEFKINHGHSTKLIDSEVGMGIYFSETNINLNEYLFDKFEYDYENRLMVFPLNPDKSICLFDKIVDNLVEAYFYGDKVTELNRDRAIYNFDTFEKFFMYQIEDFTFHIKYSVECEGKMESMWFDVEKIENGKIFAILANEPIFCTNLKLGDSLEFAVEDIDDWIITDGHNGLINCDNCFIYSSEFVKNNLVA